MLLPHGFENPLSAKGSSNSYGEDYAYDANGNIKTLVRRTIESNVMDNLTYHYDKESNGASHWLQSNRLYHYNDNAPLYVAVDGDLSNTATSFDATNSTINTTNNFSYDEIGNLVHDESEEIDSIAWDVYGKIKSITHISTSNKPDLAFAYMPTGERAIKVEMTKNTDGSIKPSSNWNFTSYMRDASGNVLNTISSNNGPNNLSNEYSIYGSSRLGVWSPNVLTNYLDSLSARGDEYRIAGDKLYELSNHLGNVMVTVSDKKLGIDNNSDGKANVYYADVISMNDYYAFGMQMPGRIYSSPSYRYGFNGKEKDDEVKGNGNQQDYGFRIYDTRLGRFLSVDPITAEYPELTPYQFASNTPIQAIDLDGLEGVKSTVAIADFGGGGVVLSSSALAAKELGMNMVYNATGSVPLGGGGVWSTPSGGMPRGYRASAAVTREVTAITAPVEPIYANTPGAIKMTRTNSTNTQINRTTNSNLSTNTLKRDDAVESISQQARQWQGKGDYPGVDNWRDITIKKGTQVGGGLPGQSSFYTTLRGYGRSGGIVGRLWNSLQVKINPTFGPRTKFGIYEFTKDTKVAFGTTYANPQFGKGGAPQIYIPDWQTALKQIRIDDLKNE